MKVKFKKAEDLHRIVTAATQYHEESVFKLKEEGMLQELEHPSGASAYASFVPEQALEVYDVEPNTNIGVRIEKFEEIIPSSDEPITLNINLGDGVHKIEADIDGRSYTIPLINVQSVSQVPETLPNLDLPVKIWGEVDWLMDFISNAVSYVHGDSPGNFWISANTGLLYLFTKKDDFEASESIHWEDFDDYDINWSQLTEGDEGTMAVKDPAQQQRSEVLLSSELVDDIEPFGDQMRLEFGHGLPLKLVCQSEDGVRASWFISPRFPTDSELGKVPDRIIGDRGL